MSTSAQSKAASAWAAVRERLAEGMAAGEGDLDLSALAEGSRRAAHLDD